MAIVRKNITTHEDPAPTPHVSNVIDTKVETDYDRKSTRSASRSESLASNAGWQDFADLTTQTTPLQVTSVSGGSLQLTCDNEGVLTDGNTNYNENTTMDDVKDIWSTTSNTIQFKGTGLQVNQNVFARIHVKISPNVVPADFDIELDFYTEENAGGTKAFSLKKHLDEITTSAGVFEEYVEEFRFFIGESILNGSATINIIGTKAFDVEVVGFNFLIISNDLN